MPSLTPFGTTSSSLTDKAAQLLTNLQSRLYHRNAVFRKETTHSGHRFERTLLKEPTKCSHCNSVIFGLVPTGQRCKYCKLMSHEKCLYLIKTVCIVEQSLKTQKPKSEHHFEKKWYTTPTMCDHCGVMLKGLYHQGVQCSTCLRNIHQDCVQLVRTDCHPRLAEPKSSPGQFEAQQNLEATSYTHQSRLGIQDFDIIRLLGVGSFSKVYLAKLQLDDTAEEFAIKVIHKTNLIVSSDPESVFTEWKALNLGRRYPFLTVGHCCFQSRDRLFFVMEHVIGKDLVYHIRRARKFTEHRARFYAAEIVLALMFLHSQRLIYRDLKLDNIILDRFGHCKLLDFGMSKILSSNQRARTFCGTPSYMSPEVIRGEEYDYSTDWWALGVLMFEMLIGSTPFEADSEEEIYHAIMHRNVSFPPSLSNRARSILEGLLIREPQNRLGCQLMDDGAGAIKQHPFFLFNLSDGSEAHLWDDIEAKRISPPYKPSVEDLQPDSELIDENFKLTPVSPSQLDRVNQFDFTHFSCYSDSFRDLNFIE